MARAPAGPEMAGDPAGHSGVQGAESYHYRKHVEQWPERRGPCGNDRDRARTIARPARHGRSRSDPGRQRSRHSGRADSI